MMTLTGLLLRRGGRGLREGGALARGLGTPRGDGRRRRAAQHGLL